MNRLLINWLTGMHILSTMYGLSIGGYEVYTDQKTRFFSEKSDDMYQGSARGSIRGLGYLYRTALETPQIWTEEKDIFWKEK